MRNTLLQALSRRRGPESLGNHCSEKRSGVSMFASESAPASLRNWRTSSHCNTGGCVQVAFANSVVALRDSKNPDRGILYFTRTEWDGFLKAVKAGTLGG